MTDQSGMIFSSFDMQPVELRCEYLKNPSGIDEPAPRLSWQLRAEGRGRRQTAYHILVARSPEMFIQDKGDLWDSGKVISNQTVQVVYAGTPLVSRQRCWWTVRVWDEDNQVGTSALVELPVYETASVREGQSPLEAVPGISFVRNVQDRKVYHVEAGEYHFTVA